ncbi:MAG TPA: hypothetical protein VFR37_05885 [Longimicrobium sp.]|nr:hypothetical protein [Longimicrobium sp.]
MRSTALIHATAGLLLASCNPFTQACTLIACQDGLAVEFAAAPTGPFTVEAWSEARIAPQVFECAVPANCPSVFLESFQGQQVTIRVTTTASVRTQQFPGVEYERIYPNGRNCGGDCRQATVTFPA